MSRVAAQCQSFLVARNNLDFHFQFGNATQKSNAFLLQALALDENFIQAIHEFVNFAMNFEHTISRSRGQVVSGGTKVWTFISMDRHDRAAYFSPSERAK